MADKPTVYEYLRGVYFTPGNKYKIVIYGLNSGTVLYNGHIFDVPFGVCSDFVHKDHQDEKEGLVELWVSLLQ